MATRTNSAFRLSYEVRAQLRASPAAVWAKLTDAAGFPSWNSTVTSLEGPITQGQRLTIRVPIAPDRAFRPTVVELVPEQRMVWRDGMLPFFQGTRTFTLTPKDGGCEFAMEEVFRGAMLPLIKPSLPDFGPVFDRYAQDLKAACER